MLRFAAQQDLVRAQQKDDYYRQQLAEQFKELVATIAGACSASYQRECSAISELAYDVANTIVDRRTLGEEYCDLRRVTAAKFSRPSLARRSLLIILRSIVPFIYDKIKSLSARNCHWTFAFIIRCVVRLSSMMVSVRLAHLAFFYLTGNYLTLSARFSGIRYIYTRVMDACRPSYRILGVLILTQLFISFGMHAFQHTEALMSRFIHPKPENSRNQNELLQLKKSSVQEITDESRRVDTSLPAPTCSLCLSARQRATVTECGHVFCWYCICGWCANKAECPLCRQPIMIANLVALVNYL